MENSLFIHPIGQSGNIYSTYFDNYLFLWKNIQYIPMKTKDYFYSNKLMLIK